MSLLLHCIGLISVIGLSNQRRFTLRAAIRNLKDSRLVTGKSPEVTLEQLQWVIRHDCLGLVNVMSLRGIQWPTIHVRIGKVPVLRLISRSLFNEIQSRGPAFDELIAQMRALEVKTPVLVYCAFYRRTPKVLIVADTDPLGCGHTNAGIRHARDKVDLLKRVFHQAEGEVRLGELWDDVKTDLIVAEKREFWVGVKTTLRISRVLRKRNTQTAV